MSSYRQNYMHIVLNTYRRKNVLPVPYHEDLYKYIWGILKNRKCTLYQINGTENHVHIFIDLHASIALADLIKEVKTASNKWMKSTGLFPRFTSWGSGYGAFSKSRKDKEIVINYIKRQKKHHNVVTYEDEFRTILKKEKIEWDERHLFT